MSDVELNAAEEVPSTPERLQLEALSSTAPLSSKKTVRFGDNSNVLCERESIISLQDGAERSSLSNLNTVMTSNLGTTAWCAPELLTTENKTRYSVKVDVYSFGIVLWELWERKRPYEELYSRFDIIDAVREGRRPPISSTCPPAFRFLIQRCWHEQPARRPTFAYIVRYIKDELAHITRQRMSSASTTGSSHTFSPLHQFLLNNRRSVSSKSVREYSKSPARSAPSTEEALSTKLFQDAPAGAAEDIKTGAKSRWAGSLSPIPNRATSRKSKDF